MSTKIDLYNQVRTLLRETGQITSETQDSKIVELLNTNWQDTVDALLREDYWTFARTRAQLSWDGETPTFGWRYRYLRAPEDVRLLPMFVNGYNTARRILYELEGRYILTDQAAPLLVRYIRNNVEPAEFDPLFKKLLVVDLALAVAGALTGKVTHVEILSSMRPALKDRAAQINSLEQEPEYAEPDTLTEARGWPA